VHGAVGAAPGNAVEPELHAALKRFVSKTHMQAHPARMEVSACSPELSKKTHLFKAFNAELGRMGKEPVTYMTFSSMVVALQQSSGYVLARWESESCGPDCCLYLRVRVPASQGCFRRT
jgi:hypothetical protein